MDLIKKRIIHEVYVNMLTVRKASEKLDITFDSAKHIVTRHEEKYLKIIGETVSIDQQKLVAKKFIERKTLDDIADDMKLDVNLIYIMTRRRHMLALKKK